VAYVRYADESLCESDCHAYRTTLILGQDRQDFPSYVHSASVFMLLVGMSIESRC
jgi:hypothetical protein